MPISLLMSKTPRQPNRHSRYDNAQHCALSAAYKKSLHYIPLQKMTKMLCSAEGMSKSKITNNDPKF